MLNEQAQTFNTNKIIIDELLTEEQSSRESIDRKNLKYVIYIPAYVGINIKTFKQLSFQNLSANLTLTLRVAIRVNDLPEKLRKKIIQHMVLQVRRNQGLKLHSPDDLEINQGKKDNIHYFLIRKYFQVRMEPYVFFTPFQVVDMIISFHLKMLAFQFINDKGVRQLIYVCFNVINRETKSDNSDIQQLINFTQDCTFANYDLAEGRLFAQFTENQGPSSLIDLNRNMYNCKCFQYDKIKTDQIILQKKSFRTGYQALPVTSYSHFHIPLYRFPASVFVTVFIPLWILGVLNLSVFYAKQNGLTSKIDNIANIILAYFALLWVMNKNIPKHPYLTVMEIIVYIEMVTPLLAILQALYNQDVDNFYSNANYLISLFVTVLVIILPIIGALVYKFILYKKHNRKVKQKYNPQNKHDEKQWKQSIKIQQKYRQYSQNQTIKDHFCSEIHNKEKYKQIKQKLARIQRIALLA